MSIRTASRQEEAGPLPLFENAQTAVAGIADPGRHPALPGNAGGSGARGSALVSGGLSAGGSRELGIAGGSGGLRSAGGSPAASGGSPDEPGPRYSKRNLPHFERPWEKYAITFATRKRRVLSPAARDLVLDCILHWRGHRYELFAACVMPDHVHLLIEPAIKQTDENGNAVFYSLTEILHTIKSFTAHEISKLEKTREAIWETESFDRIVRSERDLQEKFDYIIQNPWTAGIADAAYPWIWYSGIENTKEFAASRREQPASGLCSSDEPHVIIGTHALLYDKVSFSNLGLVVIDEQHKFGVAQRARLTSREPAPDVLVMTATPIPRTITMTVYGDLDVSTLDEMPRGRGKIITAVRSSSKLGEVLSFLRTQLEAGRQIYVVYPLVDESEKLEAKAAAAEYDRWRERLHPYPCELLHGRIAGPEKQEIMERFRRGQTKALISTTVIEVGVDVPNATVMLIENAERFGLAQLHQLRGRIGRGEHKSYCILLTDEPTAEAAAKLAVLEKTTDGFEVAEADWELRGPGDLLGTAQSGLPALKIGDLRKDAQLMKRARTSAMSIFEMDPGLEWPENQRFRQLIVEQQGRTFSNVS
ncbi:MAG TPA: helicase-related protein [Chthoniobacterales bacterium]|nr:helicase-related protein [Chthoniobacterales bacterium]